MTGVPIAFAAGLLTFFSPCILPLIPAYLTYLAGTTVNENGSQARIFINTLLFVAGFVSVFALLGVILHTVLSHASYAVQLWLSRIGGLVIIIFGIHLTGLLRIPYLDREHTLHPACTPSYYASIIFGAAFAVGWTPCIGPVLGSILLIAAAQPANAFLLLLTYALGVALPFLIFGAFTAQAGHLVARLGKHLRWIQIMIGVLLILLGILVFSGRLGDLGSTLMLTATF